ncbi:hypothetical protein [Actibacterium sp. 188UL27-1]|uniref:hypothetical protein n=1 Tax=Actibacterium sp. 188UL27-1 TaxID=2786961 RepID=UPI00195E8A1A|nr:hypothetical protein [Actibacterium sp. 188UL27-1]MBM7069380.1 hypothetical protein [Actibacterium sp. 188UL27-1]
MTTPMVALLRVRNRTVSMAQHKIVGGRGLCNKAMAPAEAGRLGWKRDRFAAIEAATHGECMQNQRHRKAHKQQHLRWVLITLFICLSGQLAQAQVQCLIPQNDDSGTLAFENDCDVDIVFEVKIGNRDFRDHQCFTTEHGIYPCQRIIRARTKVEIQVPVGDLKGGYRACYLQDLGKPICEFRKKP